MERTNRAGRPAGMRRTRLINDGLLTWPFVRLDDDRFPPGWRMESHRHSFLQIIYVVSGRGVHHMDGDHPFRAGDLLIVGPQTYHAWSNGRRGWLEVVDIGIDVEGQQGKSALDPLVRFARERPGGIACEAHPLTHHITAIRTAIREAAPYVHLRIQGLLWHLLSDIARSADQAPRAHRGAEGADELVDALERVIDARHGSRLALGDLADAVHVSPKYLCRIVRQERGTTPMRLLTAHRLKRSASLLGDAGDADGVIDDVARAVGIPDRHQFTRLFRIAYGRTPAEHRNLLRNH